VSSSICGAAGAAAIHIPNQGEESTMQNIKVRCSLEKWPLCEMIGARGAGEAVWNALARSRAGRSKNVRGCCDLASHTLR